MVLLFGMLTAVNFISNPYEELKQQQILFKTQEENSVDIVFIGNSSTFTYYNVMEIWGEYGITSLCYTADSMLFDLTIPMIEMARENQSPEAYVIELRPLVSSEYRSKYFGTEEASNSTTRYEANLNAFHDSYYKFENILMYDYISKDEKYLHAISSLFYHDTFLSGLTHTYEPTEYKGHETYFRKKNMSDSYVNLDNVESNEEYELTDETVEQLEELFEYCRENNINAIFNFTPYTEERVHNDVEIRREIGELVVENGFYFNDYRNQFENIGLDVVNDFYNARHVNINGAYKFTHYAMNDILKTSEFDKDYDESVVQSWNEEYNEWIEMVYQEIDSRNWVGYK